MVVSDGIASNKSSRVSDVKAGKKGRKEKDGEALPKSGRQGGFEYGALTVPERQLSADGRLDI